ncbi:MAG: histidine phosphatase family protein [Nakamurella sp.]
MVGKFYYRPPGGESWTDVAGRLRSLLRDVDAEHPGGRVLFVAHDAVILLIRYVCEQLTEEQLLQIAGANTVMNASATRLTRSSGTGRWQLQAFNAVDHLEQTGTPVTQHSGDTDVRPG